MLERPGRVSEARTADRLQLSYKHTCIISLELRPKTGETVSSAYTNEGRLFQTVRARRGQHENRRAATQILILLITSLFEPVSVTVTQVPCWSTFMWPASSAVQMRSVILCNKRICICIHVCIYRQYSATTCDCSWKLQAQSIHHVANSTRMCLASIASSLQPDCMSDHAPQPGQLLIANLCFKAKTSLCAMSTRLPMTWWSIVGL